MNNKYIYDVEIYPNLFMVSFIPEDTPQELINVYKKIDTLYLAVKANKREDDINQLISDKQYVLQAMHIKQFIIWIDFKSGNWKNDGALIMDFFIQHKILTGYNSNNYDRYMLDVFINSYKYLDNRGFNKKEGKHITQILFDHSSSCVQFGNGYGRLLDFKKYYKRPFTDYDIQKILYLDKTFTSLKQVAICLKWYRIQNLPIPFNKPILENEIFDIFDYNVNDVLITLTLKRNQKSEIELREDISEEFGIDVRNMSRSSIGKAITTSLYEKFSGVSKKDFIDTRTDRYRISISSILSDRIQFKTKILSDLLRTIRQQTIVVGSEDKKDKFNHTFKFGDTTYNMALGGLHSKDESGIIIATEDCAIRDADVASYYPNGILSYDVYPAHLQRNPFRATVGYTKDTRVEAKHLAGKLGKEAKSILNDLNIAKSNKNNNEIEILDNQYKLLSSDSKRYKTKAEGLKIAINRMYGAFRDRNDYLYDPKCTYKVTINLQLCLLMLIEALELKGIKVISANTDGIVCKVRKDQETLYKECCDWWQQYNNFELEFTDYEKYLRNDVNNYIAVKKGFKEAYNNLSDKTPEAIKEIEDNYIKRKGLFIEEIVFNKGYQHPIVPKALNLELLYDIPYKQTIENHIHTSPDAIYDYCISQKTDAKFTIIYRYVKNGKIVDEELQKSNRFYITNIGKNGGTILKVDKNANNKTSRIVTKVSVEPFNDYFESDNYDIDFAFYNNECAKILYGKNKKTEGMKKIQYDLFGAIETEDHLKLDDYVENSQELIEVDFSSDNINISKNNSIVDDIIRTTPDWQKLGYSSEDDYIKNIEFQNKQQEQLENTPKLDYSDDCWDEDEIPF